MGLEEKLLIAEMMAKTKREIEAMNRVAVDKACKRFAELASGKVEPFATATESVWVVSLGTKPGVKILPDGSWLSIPAGPGRVMALVNRGVVSVPDVEELEDEMVRMLRGESDQS